ncbi:MAG: hypothetical protein WDZ44_00890, partial [Candidatus Spechtbacterales bacterium]
MAQQQNPLGKPQGIIRTMQQDIDRAEGRGGDAFEDIANASPLPTQTPQESPEAMLGMDIPMPNTPTTTPREPPIFKPAPTPVPPSAQAPTPRPTTPSAPVAPKAPAPQAAPQLTDEELDALLPLDGAPSLPTSGLPSAPTPTTSPTPPAPDFGSLTRRVPPAQGAPSSTAGIANQAPSSRPMDDIAPVQTPRPLGGGSAPARTQNGAAPPANLPVGNGPRLTPAAPPVFEPTPTPAPTPATPVPQPIPPFGTPPQQGLEEGEDLPAQTPEELLGLGLDETPAPTPTPQPTAPSAQATPQASDLESPVFVEEKQSLLSSRALLITAAGLFIAALAGTLAYFFFFAGSEPAPILEESTTPPVQEEPIIPPSPLITPDRVDEISITRLSTQALQAALIQIEEEDLQPGSITYLPVRLAEDSSDGREQYLTAQLFFTTLGVALPEEFL